MRENVGKVGKLLANGRGKEKNEDDREWPRGLHPAQGSYAAAQDIPTR